MRIANAVHERIFYAGVDKVSISSTPINTFTKGKPKPIKAAIKNPALPSTVKLPLKATGSGRKTLKEKGRLSFKVQVTYTPTGGTPTSQTLSGKLKLKPKR